MQLKRMAGARPPTSIDALRSPAGDLATDSAAKLHVLRAHYQGFATPPLEPDPDLPDDVRSHHAFVESFVHDLKAHPHPDNPLLDKPIDEQEVIYAISKLKRYKAAGADTIPPELLKSGGSAVTTMLTSLFNIVWRSELVPAPGGTGSSASTSPGTAPPVATTAQSPSCR